MSDEQGSPEKKTPGKLQYILAWMIAVSLTNLATTFIDETLTRKMVLGSEDLNHYFIVAVPIEVAVALSIMIVIYSLFKSLNITKIIPWIWGLGGIGLFWNLGKSSFQLNSAGVALPPAMFVTMISGFVVLVLLFRWYFKMKGRC